MDKKHREMEVACTKFIGLYVEGEIWRQEMERSLQKEGGGEDLVVRDERS